jgi:hypothetical protein
MADTTIDGQLRKVVGHFAQRLLFARSHQREIHQGQPVRQRSELDQGLNPKTGMPLEYDPKLDVQIYNPDPRARGDGQSGHTDVARRYRASTDRVQPGQNIAYGVGIEGCARRAAPSQVSVAAGHRRQDSEKRTYAAICTRLCNGVRRSAQGHREGCRRLRSDRGPPTRPADSSLRRYKMGGSSYNDDTLKNLHSTSAALKGRP